MHFKRLILTKKVKIYKLKKLSKIFKTIYKNGKNFKI